MRYSLNRVLIAPLVVAVLLCSQITLLKYSEGTSVPSLNHFPDSVKFTFEKSTGEKLHKLYLTSESNITNVKASFTDLQSGDDYDFIPSSVFTILPVPFNITSGKMSELTVRAMLNDNYTAGTYIGRLTLLYSNMTVNIGTEIKIIEEAIAFDVITARPSSIKFVFNEQDPRVKYIPLDITTNKTLRNINYEFTELRNENGTTISPMMEVKLKTQPFSIARGNVTTMTVTVDLSGVTYPPGSYEGSLKLTSAGILTRVPITVLINPPGIWHAPYVIVLVIAGIILSILLILAREGMRVKSSVKDSAQKAYDSLVTAIHEERKSLNEISRGLSSFQLGVIEIRERYHYSDAIVKFTKAKEFFDKASKDGDQIDEIQPMPSIDDVRAKVDESTLAGLAVTFQGDRLMAIGFSIVAAIVILTTLQTVSPDLLVIDSIADVAGAILFGFGSPAIANHLVPLFRKNDSSN